ncbi:MAG: hypothetical protein HQK97_13240 [Nitrospirae bacterium]|nr:hypothetical protein [Nitrospirota bacterium]
MSKKNPYSTTPNSQNANKLLKKALDSKDPYRIGIALHTFADTWSHQNFTGMQEDWNAVYPWYDFVKNLAPHIGHANAGHSPDVISETWTDHRLARADRQMVNGVRALDAVQKIYESLSQFTAKGPKWSNVANIYSGSIINADDFNSRIGAIATLVKNSCNNESVPAYDSNTWINDALQKNGLKVEFKDENTLKYTHWYKFNQAAKEQLAVVADLIKDL